MRSRSWAFVGLWLFGVASGWACSSSSTETGSAAPVPQSQVTDSAVAAYCNGYRGCCTSSGFAFNQAGCEAAVRAHMGTSPVCAHGTYNSVAAGECFQGITSAYATCLRTLPANSTAFNACNRVCVGTQPPGAPCTSNSDCAPPASGHAECTSPTSSSASSQRACVAFFVGTDGDACSQTCTLGANGRDRSCVTAGLSSSQDAGAITSTTTCYTNDGLYCPLFGSKTCQPLVATAGECSDESACIAGTYCDLVTGTCVAKVAVGGACTSSSACVDTTYCGASGTCDARQPDGAACTSFTECQGYCDTTKLCAGASTVGSPALTVNAEICNGAISF
jgi:hypothetical protein